MTIAVAPTILSTKSYADRAGLSGGDRNASSNPPFGPAQTATSAPANIQSMQRVGSVVVPPGANTTVPLGGRFDVWFDLANYTLLVDIVSQQIGGPS